MGVDVPAQRCAAVVGCPSTDRGQLSFAVRRLSSAPALAVACWKLIWPWAVFSLKKVRALVAQPDRAPDFESGGREFESLRARQVSRSGRLPLGTMGRSRRLPSTAKTRNNPRQRMNRREVSMRFNISWFAAAVGLGGTLVVAGVVSVRAQAQTAAALSGI